MFYCVISKPQLSSLVTSINEILAENCTLQGGIGTRAGPEYLQAFLCDFNCTDLSGTQSLTNEDG